MVEITTTPRTGDDHHDVWFGEDCIGAVRPTDVGWVALPAGAPVVLRESERDAVYALVHAHTGGGYITAPSEVGDAG